MSLHRKDGEADGRGTKQRGPPACPGAQPRHRCPNVAGAGGRGARRSDGTEPWSRAGAALKPTLLAFRGGVQLAEHNAPWGSDAAGPAGPGAAGDERIELGAGSRRPPAAPVQPAPIGELGGRRRPLDRGRGTIQLRETSGNLSGSGSETHQHFSPADANCCQSLLLDPDAMIGIDLHKRLFLLVTGRGE